MGSKANLGRPTMVLIGQVGFLAHGTRWAGRLTLKLIAEIAPETVV